jgi:hypothetical protein
MKTIKYLVFFILLTANAFSQDTINHYNTENLVGETFSNPGLYDYDGEYQISINSGSSNCTTGEPTDDPSRDFIVLTGDTETIEYPYAGIGWVGAPPEGQTVYKQSAPHIFDVTGTEWMSHPTSLASNVWKYN